MLLLFRIFSLLPTPPNLSQVSTSGSVFFTSTLGTFPRGTADNSDYFTQVVNVGQELDGGKESPILHSSDRSKQMTFWKAALC